MEGFSEDELHGVFIKNIRLELKSRLKETHQNNNAALALIATGLAFFAGMLIIDRLWVDDSVWKSIFFYISDIAATVAIREAVTILGVEQKEKRAYLRDLRYRFSDIRFLKNE